MRFDVKTQTVQFCFYRLQGGGKPSNGYEECRWPNSARPNNSTLWGQITQHTDGRLPSSDEVVYYNNPFGLPVALLDFRKFFDSYDVIGIYLVLVGVTSCIQRRCAQRPQARRQ